jgi:hypothetical protein
MSMRRRRIVSVLGACAVAAVASGPASQTADAHQQTAAPAPERPAKEPRNDNAAHPTMHVTGCIERGVIPGSFMLTQVDVAGTDAAAGTTTPGGSPGTSGQADDRAMAGERVDAHAAPAQTYTLRSLERGTDLDKYIGKRVAVTGRLTADRDQRGLGTRGTTGDAKNKAAGGTTSSDRPGATPAAATNAAAAANIRQLDADSIRTIAGTCTPASSHR